MGTAVLIAWIPVCVALFGLCHPRRALVLAYLGGWLLLPMTAVPIEGFWDLDKTLVMNAGVFLGLLLWYSGLLKIPRSGIADVAFAFFMVAACLTSLTNELGLYNGLSTACRQLFIYGMPFLTGRLLLGNRQSLHEAARLIVIAAAVYAILAVWEWRMSPQLHRLVYGFHQHELITLRRWGFFRPVVFFPMTLGLGAFFMWTSLLCISLWRAGQGQPAWRIPASVVLGLPIIGLLSTMSFGPYGLFAAGAVLLLLPRRRVWRRLLWVPVAFSFCWIGGRYTGLVEGGGFSAAVAKLSEERASSLQYRVNAEDLLLARAKERPFLGWGGYGRNQVRDDTGRWLVAMDGLWIIFLGCYGLFGLSMFFLWWYAPLFLSWPSGLAWEQDPVLSALLVAVGLQSVYFLFNGFLDPVLTLMCGGTVTVLSDARVAQRIGYQSRAAVPPAISFLRARR